MGRPQNPDKDHQVPERGVEFAQRPWGTVENGPRYDRTLHGIRKQFSIPVTVKATDAGLWVSGTFVLRQTVFGSEPFSALGGLLSVRDLIMIEFKLEAKPR